MDTRTLARQLKKLREDQNISLRELSRRAGIAGASLLSIENAKSSPTMATLHKVLKALGTDYAEFFTRMQPTDTSPVFKAADMISIKDRKRHAFFCFPRREDIRFQLIHGEHRPERSAQWEAHDFDLGGMVLSGGPMKLEIKGRGEWLVSEGDAFYVKAGLKHKGINTGKEPMNTVTVAYPPRY